MCSPLILTASIFGAIGPTLAQDTVDKVANQDEIEVIVVTGTRITRRDFRTASPLTTIDKASIEFTPQATIEETLTQMPQVFPGDGRTSNGLGDGMSTVDLRGLGPGRSLVLLNGRRLAPSGTGNAVYLNHIPRFLIERVEIITGGTSAVYGSDAVAGVINFVTADDLDGFSAETSYYVTAKGDAESRDLSVAYGHNFANGHGNVTYYANWLDREPLFATERDFTSDLHWDDGFGNLEPFGSWSTPAGVVRWPRADLGNGPVSVTFLKDGTPREFGGHSEAYNYSHVNYLQLPIQRLALGALGHYDLSNRLEGYFEASFTRNEPVHNAAPAADWIDLEINFDNPVLTPEARQVFTDNYSCEPNLACISFSKRFPEFGQRWAKYQRDYSRLVTGVRGELSEDWTLDAWVTLTKGSATMRLFNSASRSRFRQGMLIDPVTNECYDPDGGCVPLNVFGEENLSPEAIEFLRYQVFEETEERTQTLASMYVTGSPTDTWAGPLDTAVGLVWRRDDTEFSGDDAFVSGDVFGYGGAIPVVGVEDVYEIYGEAVIPLLNDQAYARRLELELGARYSRYDHAGGVWTYKAGGLWQPADGIVLRAMHQRSVRAPNSTEMFEQQSVSFARLIRNSFLDPCSASADPVGNGNVEKCVMQGLPESQIGIFEATEDFVVEFTSGGNPNLETEVAETLTVGTIITPAFAPDLAVSVDYFDMEVTDTIGGISSFDICFDSLNTANVFCENIERNLDGDIEQVTDLINNRGLLETTGVDTQIQYRRDVSKKLAWRDQSAEVILNLYWTRIFSHKSQENPVTRTIDCAGYFGCDYRAIPENRVTANINYDSGPLGLHLNWRWIEGTINSYILEEWFYDWWTDLNDLAVPTVADKNYLDLGISYDFSDAVSANLVVANATNTDPPQMAELAWAYNTDTGLYDVFGRSYFLRLAVEF